MTWLHPKLRTLPEPEPESEEQQRFTSTEILIEFLTIPDDRWPDTLMTYPSLAAVIREELISLRAELEHLHNRRAAMISILHDTHDSLQRMER